MTEADAELLVDHLLGIWELEGELLSRAEANGQDGLDAGDLVAILASAELPTRVIIGPEGGSATLGELTLVFDPASSETAVDITEESAEALGDLSELHSVIGPVHRVRLTPLTTSAQRGWRRPGGSDLISGTRPPHRRFYAYRLIPALTDPAGLAMIYKGDVYVGRNSFWYNPPGRDAYVVPTEHVAALNRVMGLITAPVDDESPSDFTVAMAEISFEPCPDDLRLLSFRRDATHSGISRYQDLAPLGDRVPIVLIHGIDLNEHLSSSCGFPPWGTRSKRDLWSDFHDEVWSSDDIVADHRFYEEFKIYEVIYPTTLGWEWAGARLAVEINSHPELGSADNIFIVAHSMGGLVARQAMLNNGVGSSVRRLFTLATPHHGSVAESLAHLRTPSPSLSSGERAAWETLMDNLVTPRWRFKTAYLSAGYQSFLYDNYDQGIPISWQSAGTPGQISVPVNPTLLEFNQSYPQALCDRIVAFAGGQLRVTGATYWLPDIIRDIEAAMAIQVADFGENNPDSSEPGYPDADPVVTRNSALFAGREILETRVLDDVEHTEITGDPRVIRAIFEHIGSHSLDLAGHIGGESNAIAAAGDLVLIGAGQHLMVMNIASPSAPFEMAQLMLPEAVQGIAISGTLAHVAIGSSGLALVDVSNPLQPNLRAIADTPGEARAVAVAGSRAYVADGQAGLRIIDVYNPDQPSPRGYLDTTGECQGVALSGLRAFVADGGGGLIVVNIADPDAPVPVGSSPIPGYSQGIARSVDVAGGRAYVAADVWDLHVFDATGPSDPPWLGALQNIPGAALDVAISGDLAFLACDGGGLQIVDVTDPGNMGIVGAQTSIPAASAIAIEGNLAILSDKYTGLVIAGADSPASPVPLGRFITPGYALDVVVADSIAYVANHWGGLVTLDVSAPASPSPLGSIDTPGLAFDLAIGNGLALVADYGAGMQIIDISDPTNPAHRYTVASNDRTRGVALAGSLAYMADGTGGMRIFDVSDPDSPLARGHTATAGPAMRVDLAGTMAYVAAGDAGLQIIDVGNPAAPSARGTLDTPGTALDVQVAGDHAFVADGLGGLRVVNVSNPWSPQLAGTVDTPGNAVSVTVAGDRVLVSDNPGDLHVIDISDPAHPQLVSTVYDLPSILGMAQAGNLLFVAAQREGLWILHW